MTGEPEKDPFASDGRIRPAKLPVHPKRRRELKNGPRSLGSRTQEWLDQVQLLAIVTRVDRRFLVVFD